METPTFVDGIGRRLRTADPTGDEVETLRLCRELSEAATTEAALIERASRVAAFSHHAFAEIRRVERLGGALGGLAVVSAAIPGTRLSEILRHAHHRWIAPDFDAARCLIEQIAGALADFHQHSRDLAHGAIGPERIVVCPDGRAVIVEHVLGSALQQLQMGRTPLWTQFRVPAPAVAGMARFDQITDVMQLGVLALALVLGRPIRRDEYPHQLQSLLAEASTSDPLGERRTVSRALRSWILRTFQVEPRTSFRTAAEAAAAFEAVVARESCHQQNLASVVRYLAACSPGTEAATSYPPAGSPQRSADIVPPAVGGDDFAVGTIRAAERLATVRVFRSDIPGPEPHPPQVVAEVARNERVMRIGPQAQVRRKRAPSGLDQISRVATDAVRASVQFATKLDWSAARGGARIAMLSIALVTLYGVTYLGARGYLGLPSVTGGRGTLVVESRPAGIDLYVDGFLSGQTPATLELRAGDHTLVLRTGRGITLVPVAVVAGASRVEFVEVRSRRLASRPQTAAAPRLLPAPRLPQ